MKLHQAELCRRHNIPQKQLSQWKRQFLENAASLFGSGDKPSDAAAARIAHLEKRAAKLREGLEIQKKVLDWIAANRSEE